jgi:hypothetical protein
MRGEEGLHEGVDHVAMDHRSAIRNCDDAEEIRKTGHSTHGEYLGTPGMRWHLSPRMHSLSLALLEALTLREPLGQSLSTCMPGTSRTPGCRMGDEYVAIVPIEMRLVI